MLPKLLIMAVLINFSKMICGFFIDFAQVIMLTFVNGFKDMAGGNFTVLLGIDEWLKLNWRELTRKLAAGDFTLRGAIVSYFLALIMAIIATVVIGIMLVVLVARIVFLWILIVLSPIAFLAYAAPGGEKYSSQWWQAFGKYLIVGPVLAFFIWLSLTISATFISKEFVNIPEKFEIGKEKVELISEAMKEQFGEGPLVGVTTIGTPQHMLNYIIAIAMLIAGLMVTQSLGVAGGKLAGKAVGGMKDWVTGKFGPSPMRWARERWEAYGAIRRGIRKERAEEAAKWLSDIRERISARWALLTPTVRREAAKRHREYEKHQKERAAKLHNIYAMSPEELLRAAQSRDKYLRMAAVEKMAKGKLLREDERGIEIVNRALEDMRDVPEDRRAFRDEIIKGNIELAARSNIFHGFPAPEPGDTEDERRQKRENVERLFRQIDLKNTSIPIVLSRLSDEMINNLRRAMREILGEKLSVRVIREAEDDKELKKWYDSLSRERKNLVFDDLRDTDLRTPEEREKAALGTGRYHQIWDMSSGVHQREYQNFVESNQSKVEKDIDVRVLRDRDTRFLDILQRILRREGMERIIKRDRASREAFSEGEGRLVEAYNLSHDYTSEGARRARALNVAFSIRDQRLEDSYNPTIPEAQIALTEDVGAKRIKGKDLAELRARDISSENMQNIVSGISIPEIKVIFEKGRGDLMEEIRTTLESQATGRPGSRAAIMFDRLNRSEWFHV
jgi:hypothetical protein